MASSSKPAENNGASLGEYRSAGLPDCYGRDHKLLQELQAGGESHYRGARGTCRRNVSLVSTVCHLFNRNQDRQESETGRCGPTATNPRNPLPSKTSIFGGISSKRIRTTEGSCASREHASFHRPRKDLFDWQSRFSVSADDVRCWQREKMVKPHGGFKPFGALLFLVEQVDFRKPPQQFRVVTWFGPGKSIFVLVS